MGWEVGAQSNAHQRLEGFLEPCPPTPNPVAISAPPPPVSLQSSSLCLWGIALVFCATESVFAVRCAQLAHQLLELRPWWGKSSHHMVRPAIPSTAVTPLIFWEPLLGSPHPSAWGPHLRTGATMFSPGPKGEGSDLPAKTHSWLLVHPGPRTWGGGGIWAGTGGTPRVWPGMQ